jgi:hypothetical protein
MLPSVQSAFVEHMGSETGEKQEEATSAIAATERMDFMRNLLGVRGRPNPWGSRFTILHV